MLRGGGGGGRGKGEGGGEGRGWFERRVRAVMARAGRYFLLRLPRNTGDRLQWDGGICLIVAAEPIGAKAREGAVRGRCEIEGVARTHDGLRPAPFAPLTLPPIYPV